MASPWKLTRAMRQRLWEVARLRMCDPGDDALAKELQVSKRAVQYHLRRIRDRYTCQGCGVTGVPLEVDHILPYSLHPDRRLDVTNGQSLCTTCRRKTLTYGRTAEFLREGVKNLRRALVIPRAWLFQSRPDVATGEPKLEPADPTAPAAKGSRRPSRSHR